MKKTSIQFPFRKVAGIAAFGLFSISASAQTNVFDDVIATSPNHSSLEAALIAAGLDDDLQNPSGTFTVFAPDNAAFSALATQLGVTVNDLLALPNLADILTYHVLGSEVPASAVTNGAIATPLFAGNTLKLTKTSTNAVYVNQAQVNAADLTTDNGIVHSINAVLLSDETVIDVAIDNGFTALVAAVTQEELIPVLSNPFANYTVFAPTNAAFSALATSLGTDIAGLLALPNLDDVLKYHVLGTEVLSSAVTNGAIVSPLSTSNTLKLTKTSTNAVFVNHAQVTTADVQASNGVVHVLDKVVLPVNTVVDVAIDNGFTTLATAVIQEELIPVLSDPFTEFTIFAPTNTAFNNLATALGTDLAGILNLPNLSDVLTYHAVLGNVNAADLVNGPVATVNGANIIVDLTSGVKINDATVTTADVEADNGVVHVIDKVLLQTFLGIDEASSTVIGTYPNPASDVISIVGLNEGKYTILNNQGQIVKAGSLENGQIFVQELSAGSYMIQFNNTNTLTTSRFIKK